MLNTFPRLLITAAALFLGLSAASQTFPSKPVTLVSPYLAGNVSDVIARAIAEAAGKEGSMKTRTVYCDNPFQRGRT